MCNYTEFFVGGGVMFLNDFKYFKSLLLFPAFFPATLDWERVISMLQVYMDEE